MVDPAFSRQRYEEDLAAVRVRRRKLLAPALAVAALIGGGISLAWGLATQAGAPSPAFDQASTQLLAKTTALAATQQEAIDGLRNVQNEIASTKAETKKLRHQLNDVTEKLDALQLSISNMTARSSQ